MFSIVKFTNQTNFIVLRNFITIKSNNKPLIIEANYKKLFMAILIIRAMAKVTIYIQ